MKPVQINANARTDIAIENRKSITDCWIGVYFRKCLLTSATNAFNETFMEAGQKKHKMTSETKIEIKEDLKEVFDDEDLDLTSIKEIEISGDPKRDKVRISSLL
jgi:hypothetical protein